MFQLLAWIWGLTISLSINAPYWLETRFTWWVGIVFAILLQPAVWLLGLIFPRLILNLASGTMVGGFMAAAAALLSGNPSFVFGSLLTWGSGFLAAKGQYLRFG